MIYSPCGQGLGSNVRYTCNVLGFSSWWPRLFNLAILSLKAPSNFDTEKGILTFHWEDGLQPLDFPPLLSFDCIDWLVAFWLPIYFVPRDTILTISNTLKVRSLSCTCNSATSYDHWDHQASDGEWYALTSTIVLVPSHPLPIVVLW